MVWTSARGDKRKRVVIVDDSKTMQAVLDQLCSLRLGMEVVGIASDVETAAPLIRTLRPDLVTIDLCMPYIDGSKLLEMIADMPDLHKVIISGHGCANLDVVTKLRKAGADACLDKLEMSRDPAAFCNKILTVLAKRPRSASLAAETSAPRSQPSSICRTGYPVPLDEKARLIALQNAGLANDDPDHQLDLLTAHLGATTGFPTCLMTFIDHDTQWVKSAHGFARGSMPRAVAFCNYTLCGDDPFIVSNAATDPRFADNALVTGDPGIRTYAGCPIISASGVRLGAICLIDTKPRRVTPGVIVSLQSISRIAAEFIGVRTRLLAQAA